MTVCESPEFDDHEQAYFFSDSHIRTTLKSWTLPATSLTDEQLVTLKHLLSHTAGITGSSFRGYAMGRPAPVSAIAARFIGEYRLKGVPGFTFRVVSNPDGGINYIGPDGFPKPLAAFSPDLLFPIETVLRCESTPLIQRHLKSRSGRRTSTTPEKGSAVQQISRRRSRFNRPIACRFQRLNWMRAS